MKTASEAWRRKDGLLMSASQEDAAGFLFPMPKDVNFTEHGKTLYHPDLSLNYRPNILF